MRKQKIHGITLIALIITIIVLLILAGVSISMVVGDNGVLGQAINATTATDIADTKEQIELGVIGYLDSNGDYTIADIEQAVADSGATLGDDGVTVTTAKGNTFDISDLIDGAYIPTYTGPWYYDDDGNVTNGLVTLAIGDTVYYNAVTGASITSYTSSTVANGFGSQIFTLTKDSDYLWQVMGADKDTGELLIVLSYNTTTEDKYICPDSGGNYYFGKQAGYANFANELDNVCSLFGQGYGSTGARSITVEDVNKLTGYDPDAATFGSGYVYEYGNEVTYTKNSSTGYIDYQGTIYPKSLTTQTNYSSFTYYSEDDKKWITLGNKEKATFTSNAYYYNKSFYPSDLVYPSGGSYWLGNTCVSCRVGTVYLGLMKVTSTMVTNTTIFYAYETLGAITTADGVRPAVSLSCDILLSGSSSDGWSIVTE